MLYLDFFLVSYPEHFVKKFHDSTGMKELVPLHDVSDRFPDVRIVDSAVVTASVVTNFSNWKM